MQHINILTKTRWLVTIILLTFLCVGNAWGDTATNNCGSNLATSYADMEPGKAIEWKAKSATSYTSPIRIYQNNIVTFHCKAGASAITKIEITANDNTYGNLTRTTSNWSITEGTGSLSISGSSKAATITITGTVTTIAYTASAQTRWDKVIVTYTAGDASTLIDKIDAAGFADYTTNSYSTSGTDQSAVANYVNATGSTYALQVFNGSTGAVRGNGSGAANFSCRNTTTKTGYYISQVKLIVSGGTIDGSTSGRSIVYFGTNAYANPNTTAPSGTYTSASPASSGQSTLTWSNSNTSISHFILYNLKTASTATSARVEVTWTKKPSCAAPTDLTKGSFNRTQQQMPINWTSGAGKVDICYSSSSTAPAATPGSGYTVVSDQTSSPVNLSVSGLAAGNYYCWVRSVCSADSKSDWTAITGNYFTIPSHTLTVSKSAGDNSCAVSPTSSTVVEGRTVSVTATPGAGSTFTSWAVSGTNSSINSTTANPVTFTMGTANATLTATFACITPSFGTNLTTGTVNYYQGDEASALVVAATAGTATVTYQWQTKVGDGDWTNTGTNAAGNTSITPSTSSTGTIQYRCVATNSATSCSTTTESNVVTVVVSEPQCSAPTAVAASSPTNTGATLTVTDANDVNKYDFYCSTSSTAPANNVTPTASVSDGKAKAITGLAYGTTYYYWVRTDCGDSKLSPWFPSENPSTFTTTCPAPTSISANPTKPTIATFTITDNNSPAIGTYDIYYSTTGTAPDANTTPSISNTTNTSETVTTLSAGTKYYFWVRGVGANAKSAWVSGGNFTTPTLSSISVKTSPKANYLVGETFDPTGLEITLHYSNEATDDVTYAGNTGLFTFAPNTALAANNEAVRVTYGGVYVDYEVNVYSITVNKVEEDGTTAITADGVTAGCATRTLSQSEGSTNYSFWKWEFDGANNGLAISNNSITGTPTGNVTIKAFFYKPVTVTWLSNRKAVAAGSQTTEVKRGTQWKNLTKPSDPSAPTSCSSKVFKGWTNMSDDWSGDSHDSAPSVCLTSFSGITTAINEPITFKAVFASESNEVVKNEVNLVANDGSSGGTPIVNTYSAVNGNITLSQIKGASNTAVNATYCEKGTSSNRPRVYQNQTIKIEVASGYKIDSVAVKCSGTKFGNGLTANTSINNDGSVTNNTTNVTMSIDNSEGGTHEFKVNTSGGASGLYIQNAGAANTQWHLAEVNVTYLHTTATTVDYVTECCAGLDDFNGTVEWNNPTEAVLTWDAIDNVSGWAVKYKKHADANYTNFAGSITGTSSKTCTISDLKCGTDYDFQIIATPADGYCDKSETINDTQEHKYAITLDPAKGEVTGGSFIAYSESECDGEDVDIEAEAATGYSFAGWTITDKVSGDAVSPAADEATTTFEMPAENVTVAAAFNPITYTITYYDGDESDAAKAFSGSHETGYPTAHTYATATTLKSATKDNFNFGGWYDNKECTGEPVTILAADAYTANITLYALWTADDKWMVTISDYSNGSVSVSYEGMESALTSGSREITKNTVLTITASANTGYDLTALTVGGEAFTSGNTHTLTAATTIAATFVAHTYSISYNNMEDATNHDDNPATYTIEDATITLEAPTKTGYTFGGWFNNSDLAEAHKVTSIANGSTGNVVLYAKWTKNSYTLNWETDGDELTGDYTTGSVEYGADITAPVTPTKTGYTFAGWSPAVAATMPAENTTYTATWTIINYTVKWNVNNDDTYAEGEPTTSANYNTKISALPTPPTSNDCDDMKKFVGWRATKLTEASESKPSGILTKLADFPAITDNTTFYAVFADVTGGNTLELTFPDDNSSNNGLTSNQYTSTWTAKTGTFEFSIENFNNNSWNQNWAYIRCGRNGNASTASITTGSDIDFRVDSVLVTVGAINTNGVNSFKVQVADASTFASTTDIDVTQATGVQRVKITSPAKDKYYRILVDCNNKVSSNGFVQINGIVFKQKLDTANFVTKCASCDAPATFTTDVPTMSEIACTGATVTATGGLETLGSEGCNISDYGFVIGTSANPALNEDGTAPSGVTKLQVGTANPTIGADFSYDITGLTKGTQYNVRAYAVNKYGIAYSSNMSFWTKGVSSIAITTAPTKTNYIVGETFDATGMEVTATLAGGATDDVTEDATYSNAALTAGVDQDFTISYTLCETEKTANQTINVYTMSVNEGTNPDNGVATYTTGATFSVGSLAEHTTVNFDVTNGSVTPNGDGSYTVTPNGNGNVTVTVNYVTAVQVAVKYYVNGQELTGLAKNPYQSEEFDMPDASAVASAMSSASINVGDVNFVGWSATDFPYQTTEPTLAGASVSVMEATDFYAVFTNVEKVTITPDDFNGTKSINEGEKTIDGVKYNIHEMCKQTGIQFSKNGYLYTIDALKYIRKVVVTGEEPIVYACSDNAGTTSGSAITPTGSGTALAPFVYTFPADKQYLKMTDNNGVTKPQLIEIYYAPEAVYYTTQFQTLTFNKADGNKDKDEMVAKNKAYTLTADDAPTAVEHYSFLDKWTDSQNTYEIGDAVTMSTNVTLTPISAYETTGDTDIDGLPEGVTEIVVTDGKNLNVNDDKILDNLTVEAGGKVSGNGSQLTVNNLTINSEAGKSGQVMNAGNITASAVYMDVRFYSKNNATTLGSDEADVWYSISAPFDVNLNGGFFQADGTPMVFGVDFDLFEYDGNKRATTGVTGWKRAQGKMKAGVACLIGFNESQPTTIRLKAAGTTLSDPSTIDLQSYASEDDANANWNGVANPTLHYTTLDKDAQYFNNNTRGWETCTPSENSFVVGTAFFVHSDVDITLSNSINGTLRAPKRDAEDRYEYGVRISSTTDKYSTNNMFVRASEEAEASYQPGHDLQTLNNETASCALIYAENYGMRLAIEEAPILNNKASYQIGIYAPVAGEYRVETPTENESADLYLTYNGRAIWNLSMGAYEAELAKGTNNGYGLLLVKKMPMTPTGVEDVQGDKVQCTKVIIDDHVFILRGGQMYDVTGKAVK